MSNDILKAERLWRHLQIRDEYLLIRISGPDGNAEGVMVICDDGYGGIETAYVSIPPDGFDKWISEYKQPFTLVQQRNKDGCFIIPDINEWKADEELDY